jgi:hypothetical protein
VCVCVRELRERVCACVRYDCLLPLLQKVRDETVRESFCSLLDVWLPPAHILCLTYYHPFPPISPLLHLTPVGPWT